MDEFKTYYCEKCNRTMGEDQFYSSNNLVKYPNDGKLNQCKKCMTMHVDNWNPDTYLWILQEVDVPYIPDEWNKLLANYAKDRRKCTGLTIIGRYLSKMKLKQFADYRWKDTEFLQELANNKIEQAMKRQGYDAQQIADAINKASFPVPDKPLEEPAAPTGSQSPYVANGPVEYYGDSAWRVDEEPAEDDLGSELTEEDRQYLRLKWGKAYRPDEWIWLEQLYNEMLESYDIQTAGHFDTLKMICKTSLKSNQLLDIGDVDGAQKMIKMYDQLMKSGKFTAAQNKAENGEFVDSVSELVAICEKDGFIPRFYIEQPNDKADRVLQDMQGYVQDLIFNETNLGNMIENAMKGIEAQKEKEAENDFAAAGDEEDLLEQELFEQERNSYIDDEDFEEFSGLEDSLEAADDAYLTSLIKDGEIK